MNKEYHTIAAYDKIFILTALVLLPVDWFSPTGEILREAGAKPFNIFILLTGIFLLLLKKNIFLVRTRLPAQRTFLILFLLGSLSFFTSINFLPTEIYTNRSPYAQFLAQAVMLLLFIFVSQVMIYYFRINARRQFVIKVLPIVILIHIIFYLLESVGVFSNEYTLFLGLFRNEAGFIDRASGLMSEPSYYGTFAALYSVPLLIFGGNRPKLNRLLALITLASAFVVQAKTMYIVLAGQIIFLFFCQKYSKNIKLLLWITVFTVVPSAYYLLSDTSALNLEENLSSIMRLGSNALTLRAIFEGYGLAGAGIGQFHFLYIPSFAPDFLMFSKEAQDQLYGVSDSRASTFNLPLRIWVEMGILGLFLFVGLLLGAVRKTRRSLDTATLTGMCFVAGSIGFLMTQDSYCLPSLAFGLSLALTEPNYPPDSLFK